MTCERIAVVIGVGLGGAEDVAAVGGVVVIGSAPISHFHHKLGWMIVLYFSPTLRWVADSGLHFQAGYRVRTSVLASVRMSIFIKENPPKAAV